MTYHASVKKLQGHCFGRDNSYQMEKKEEDGWISTLLEEELGPPQELLAGNEKEDDSFGQKHGSSEL